MANNDGVDAPADEDDHHDRDQLHDVEGFFARFGNALGVFPPEIESNNDGEGGGNETSGTVGEMSFGDVEILAEFVEKAGKVLARGNAADRAGEDVIEHQGGDGKFGEAAAEGLLDGAIDAAANEHAAAFDVHRADGVRKNHDGENEPGSSLADEALCFAAGVVGGGSEVIENDRRGLPERNEGEKSGCGDYDARNCVAAPTLGSRAIGNRAHVWVIRPADFNARKFGRGSLVGGEYGHCGRMELRQVDIDGVDVVVATAEAQNKGAVRSNSL